MAHHRHEDIADETCRLLKRMMVESCDRSPSKLAAAISQQFPQLDRKLQGASAANVKAQDDVVLGWLREQFPDQPLIIDAVETYLI